MAADFKLGLDLGNLEDGITFEDMFIELDNLGVEGTLSTQTSIWHSATDRSRD